MPFESLKRRVLRIAQQWTINKLISQFNRLVTIETTSVLKDSDGKFPELLKWQVVTANFIGQGSVLDGNHPAVIWDVRSDREHVVVLPLTSKTRNDRFEIGNIVGLEGDSIIKTNQPQSVSRKGISAIFVVDSAGQQLLDRTGQPIPCKLSPKQVSKVQDLFLISQLEQPTLKTVINNKIGLAIPVNVDGLIISQLERPVFYGLDKGDLMIKFFDNEFLYTISLVDIGIIKFKERREHLSALLHEDSEIRSEANKRILEIHELRQNTVREVAAAHNKDV